MPKTIGEYAETVWQREQGRITPLDFTAAEREATAVPTPGPKNLCELRFVADDGTVYEGKVWGAQVVREGGSVQFHLDREGKWQPLWVRIDWFLRDGCYCRNAQEDIVIKAIANELRRQAMQPGTRTTPTPRQLAKVTARKRRRGVDVT